MSPAAKDRVKIVGQPRPLRRAASRMSNAGAP